ncbi:choline/ethanolamine kinase-like [Tetranychus urticae]|uniref:Aminoglycoside phosphotransferase domain-containing protein n=1 Tax=Tetranychus urticae TaxID=32264 RepID=T1K9U0_TETUR|nr:choline/ethanolamine kinase-like [Tetranychus urticae]
MYSEWTVKVKSICQSLLSGPWKNLSLDEITVDPITTGRSNRLFICSRPLVTSSNGPKPSTNHEESIFEQLKDEYGDVKVVVRFYGSDYTGEGNRYKCVTDEEELEILAILSSKGLSPRVLVPFAGGRIDEYVESIILPPNRLSQPTNLMIVAPKIAQYHSLQFRCQRDHDLVQIYRDNTEKACEKLETFDESIFAGCSDNSLELFRKVKTFITQKLGFRILSKMISTQHKRVFSHMDLINSNLLFPHPHLPHNPDDLMIIDVENSQNQFRGIDLGKFFAEIYLADDTKNFSSFYDSDIHIFVDCYLNQWFKIAGQFNGIDPEIDNHDHLFLEMQLGILMAITFVVPWNVLHPNFDRLDMLQNSVSRIDLYTHFCERWSHIF